VEQAYMQRHPYLTGPDSIMNHQLRRKTKRNWRRYDIHHAPVAVTALEAPGYDVDPAVRTSPNWRPAYERYAWKVNRIPHSAENVLFMGCGNGAEIGALRCIGSTARIMAVDFREAFRAEARQAFEFEFTMARWIDYLHAHRESYEAAFSNHCMEHIYNDPTEVLRAVAGCLCRGGTYVFAMPIEASASNPYARFYPWLLNSLMYSAMLDGIDCGHPWKSDLADIAQRLEGCGFAEVCFFFREGGKPYGPLVSDPLFDSPDPGPDGADASIPTVGWCATDLLLRSLYKLKSALRFDRIKNARTHEVLVVARKLEPSPA
jgi:SAM-dependent methyltransferase